MHTMNGRGPRTNSSWGNSTGGGIYKTARYTLGVATAQRRHIHNYTSVYVTLPRGRRVMHRLRLSVRPSVSRQILDHGRH